MERLLLLVAVVCTHLFVACDAACSVDVNTPDMPSPQPLLLLPDMEGNFSSFAQPDAQGLLTLQQGDQLVVACPNSNFVLLPDTDWETAVCVENTVFSVRNVSYTLNALVCAEMPLANANATADPCGGSYTQYQMGFTVNGTLYELYDVCFDDVNLVALYSHETLPTDIAGFQLSSSRRTQWQDSGLFDAVDVENQYSTQRQTLRQLLGDVTYLQGSNFLSRGHLTPRADMMLAAQQSATFQYANSAPQWYHFNSGNWNQLELDLRSFAGSRGRDLDVYTGTYGVLALPHANGSLVDVYLYVASSGSLMPVPMLFWKIAYDPQDQAAMVFLGVNNPFVSAENLTDEYRLCPDMCSEVDWLSWKTNNATAGLGYCCEYATFAASVPYAPALTVQKTFAPPSPAPRVTPGGVATLLAAVCVLARQHTL